MGANWKVSDLKAWLSDEHKLSLTAWNLPCGEVTDSDGEKRAVSARVYPAPVAVDLRKLPSLELSKPQAMMALQKHGGDDFEGNTRSQGQAGAGPQAPRHLRWSLLF